LTHFEYFLKRLALAIVVIIGVTVITFSIARLVPSNPARLWLGPRATPEQMEIVTTQLGLDRPLVDQYFIYLKQVLSGDFGISLKSRQPILKDLQIFLPATLELVVFSMVLAVLIGIPLGVISATHKNQFLDHIVRFFAVFNASTPVFWLALILQLIIVEKLNLLPLGGRVSQNIALFQPIETITGFYLIDSALSQNWIAFKDALIHLILPGIVLASGSIGIAVRLSRATLIEVLEQKYITMAWAFGLNPRLIYYRLALKNAIVPTLMVLGLTFVWSITGAILVEVIFLWPGLGSYLTRAVLNFDFPVIVSISLVVSVFYVAVNFILDLIQTLIDPRVALD
jgi:peptide/nickel transport system permease protein